MQEGLKKDQTDVQSRRKLLERGKRHTRGAHILIERDQEGIKVINIHSRDKGHLSKKEENMYGKVKELIGKGTHMIEQETEEEKAHEKKMKSRRQR